MQKTNTICRWVSHLCVFLFGLLLSHSLSAQTEGKKISGRILDANRNPISGATIMVKNTQRGFNSDQNGDFSLTAKPGEVLVFSYIGMESKEVAVSASTSTLSVILRQANANMSEVVVIGYGTAKRANLTSAQTTVTAKEMDRTINTTLEQAIQGRAAGVYITQNSGQPGGGISVNIRGVSTITGRTEPLYVIDGIQIQNNNVEFGSNSSSNPLAGLNPSDIEDIQLLQGPSASAIYGSRATNGVVLITTKRGKAGTTKFNYGFQHSIQTPPKKMEVMNLRQYATMVNQFHAIAGGETPTEFLDPSLLGEGTDWQGELFKNAPMQKHQLSASGGNDKTTFFMSGEYLKQDGVAAGSGFDRVSARLNVDNKPTNWAQIGVNLSVNRTNENLTTSQENIIANAIRLTPQIPVKNFDGSWAGGDENNGANQFAPINPLAIAELTTNKFVRHQILGNIYANIKLYKDLQFKTSFNTNVGFANGDYFLPAYKIGWAVNDRPTYSSQANTNSYWGWNQLLEYTKQIGNHTITAMAGHEAQASNWKNNGASRAGYLTNDILDINAGDPLTATNSGGSGDWAMESYFGRINYSYDNRYILNGTIRWDGSSVVGENKRWDRFPSLSAAWRISQEKFFDVPFISELKLRYETGVTGNPGSGGIFSPLQTAPTPWGTGFLPGTYANPDLKWEETKTNNFGLNIGLANNRINLEFDYYIRKTDNLLLVNPLPWYMGTNGTGAVTSPTVNIGSLQNNGWSFTLNTVNVNNNKFRWESNFNISSFVTKITKFYSESAFVDRTSWWLEDWTQRASVGSAPWLFRGYVEEGVFKSIEEIENSAVPVDNNGNRLPIDEATGLWVGDVKFKDINGDGIINEQDQTNIGNPWPKLFAGFTNNFSYKGFDLSILITATYGNDIYNYISKVSTNPNNINLSRNLLTDVMDFAKPMVDGGGKVVLQNPNTTIPRISYGPNNNHARPTSRWVEDGSFIRLKNITLGYNLPASILSKQKFIKGARLSLSGQNIFTLTKYSGLDPEVGAYVGRDASPTNQAIGLDFGRYPLTPVYAFSIGLDF
ncbi:TonB-dependent receptor [Flavihumibacter sp. CACIAM 22H1]|uniref:SusC/RagA family TonB-linked outer membrane protein n=1 Tax=Flavihumibacter sp. CACIAM 22H1 TaxID=1812911 RepID=UPI0007A91E74|nr:TonB-dependent receptor [Flavihumibacter sp. CACIAM 22H1]KYP14276.1 MAG: SusC/RagA family TonB-linked outer membrane protein [Flavihumibacter sp. CACIAM 22H1]